MQLSRGWNCFISAGRPGHYAGDVQTLDLHEFHARFNARFGSVNDSEAVLDYGDVRAEYVALRQTVGVLDLSLRGRVCVLGADRVRFLNGQITNNVKALRPGTGCYSALTNNKGKLQADLQVHALAEELLLDFEPGLAAKVTARLEQFIVADDVQLVDVAPHYGLLRVHGPQSSAVLAKLGVFPTLPDPPYASAKASDSTLGELYVMNVPRFGSAGWDLFIPTAALAAVADKLVAATKELGGRLCGWTAAEWVRVEAGVPRFGADMDESNLPHETGIEPHAVSYTKGCYIGQEVINRIRSLGQVTRALRGLRLDGTTGLPARGNKLWHEGKEVGSITSAIHSPALDAPIALGYVRKECNSPGTKLLLRAAEGDCAATIVPVPFVS